MTSLSFSKSGLIESLGVADDHIQSDFGVFAVACVAELMSLAPNSARLLDVTSFDMSSLISVVVVDSD